MKLILIFLSLSAVAALFVFCKPQPKFTADKLPDQQLRWGTGGGIVGKATTYTLLDNGQIFKQGLKGDMAELKKAKGKVAKTLFKTADALGFSKLEFDHPGNIYSFMEWQDGDAVSRVTWGDASFPVNENVKALFDQLNGLIKE